MGVVNVTSDSFSDGGKFLDHDRAIEHGLAMHRIGADIIDVGGESTRPGASLVDPEIEIARVVPVIESLAAEGVLVSVDTMHAKVASAAIDAGARIVNDVSGGRADVNMAKVVAEAGVPWVLMHWRATGDYVHGHAADEYHNVVQEVSTELLAQVDAAVKAGVDPSVVVLDPGLGFAKSAQHNWALLHALPQLVALGYPILVGASRKRFLGTLLADEAGQPRPSQGREVATAAISALSALQGAWGVRVHDAQSSLDAIAVSQVWENADIGSNDGSN
ncbi:MAG: dihydropteroate synthase [Mycobacteriaceae bacterium]